MPLVYRTGHRAHCKQCNQPIEKGEMRVVWEPITPHNPEHFHQECYFTHFREELEDVYTVSCIHFLRNQVGIDQGLCRCHTPRELHNLRYQEKQK
jgi:hypothetical protein